MTRNRPITVDELRAMTDEQLLEHRTNVAHTVATITADLHALELGGTHDKPESWYRRASYARDKHRATIEAINLIREERAAGANEANAELLAAAILLLETDLGNDTAVDAAFERLATAVDACERVTE